MFSSFSSSSAGDDGGIDCWELLLTQTQSVQTHTRAAGAISYGRREVGQLRESERGRGRGVDGLMDGVLPGVMYSCESEESRR